MTTGIREVDELKKRVNTRERFAVIMIMIERDSVVLSSFLLFLFQFVRDEESQNQDVAFVLRTSSMILG